MLGVLTQDQLRHSLFPLGDTPKPEVRREAEQRGLRVADKPDSHDICFVADGDNTGWLREKLGEKAPNHGGDIVDDATGEVLGRHGGTYAFTVGQRKGLRIGRPAPDGKPRFVLDIEPVSGTVRVGPREALTVDRLEASHGRWCAAAPERLEGTVQLRAHGGEHRAVVTTSDGGDHVTVELIDPAQGIAPGQSAVVYDGTRVVGSATITSTRGGTRRPSRRDPRMTLATGIGSLPGHRPGRGGADRRRRAARPAAPAGAPGTRARRVDDGPGPGDRRGRRVGARRRPPAGRLAADRQPAQASTSVGPAACSPRTSTCSRRRCRATPGISRSRSPGPGPSPPRSSGRAATRCSPTTAPGASWRRRSRRGCATTWPTYADGSRARAPCCSRSTSPPWERCSPRRCRRLPGSAGTGPSTGQSCPSTWRGCSRQPLSRVREPWAHSCAPGTPLDLLRGAGARGLSVDLDVLSPADHDALGEALEAGDGVALGVIPSVDPDTPPDDRALTDRVLGWLDLLGLDPDAVGQRLLITPSCGLAGASPAWVRRALTLCREVAKNLHALVEDGRSPVTKPRRAVRSVRAPGFATGLTALAQPAAYANFSDPDPHLTRTWPGRGGQRARPPHVGRRGDRALMTPLSG